MPCQHEDSINHPQHYTRGKFEVIDVIEDWGLDYHLGNAVKYIGRAAHKGAYEDDIKKAIWYLQRDLENRKGAKQSKQIELVK